MQIKEKLIEMGNKMPTGSFSSIAKEANVSYSVVSEMFSGKSKPKKETLEKIVPIAKRIIKETEDIFNN